MEMKYVEPNNFLAAITTEKLVRHSIGIYSKKIEDVRVFSSLLYVPQEKEG